jgi:hypothetical protein
MLASSCLVLILSACSSFGGGEPDISGEYEIQTSVDGAPFSALITLNKGDDGAYTGSIETGMTGTLRVTSALQEGDGWALRANGADGTVYMTMYLLDGDAVEGNWSMGGMGGDFTGVRLQR